MKYKCGYCDYIDESEKFFVITDDEKRAAAMRAYTATGKFTDKECPECENLAYRLPSLKMCAEQRGGHVWVKFFMGEDRDHRACCGDLTMLPAEWKLLSAIISEGNTSGDTTDSCDLFIEENLTPKEIRKTQIDEED